MATTKTAGQAISLRSKAVSKPLKSREMGSNSTLSRLQQASHRTEALMLLDEAGAEWINISKWTSKVAQSIHSKERWVTRAKWSKSHSITDTHLTMLTQSAPLSIKILTLSQTSTFHVMTQILQISQVKVDQKQALDSARMVIVAADKKKCKTKQHHCTRYTAQQCKRRNSSKRPIRSSLERSWDGHMNKPRKQTGLTAAPKSNYPKTRKTKL